MANDSKVVVVYHLRGQIERGSAYHWTNGYSEDIGTNVSYPWQTKTECKKDAIRRQAKARFCQGDCADCARRRG